jgi:hypothetical protein
MGISKSFESVDGTSYEAEPQRSFGVKSNHESGGFAFISLFGLSIARARLYGAQVWIERSGSIFRETTSTCMESRIVVTKLIGV